ncbi:uncharacterized protein LOC143174698 [Nomia melanderi]|uniref:uncharacterized protein LOC143174698 n=1 Tax=Nomia melanderi TaxID=2448451 RepID=UPI003FCDDD0A
MRIAHVVTACAALISAFRRAETVQPDKRLQKKGHQLQPKVYNDTDIGEITFTTLQPEVTSFSSKVHSSIQSPGRRFKTRSSHARQHRYKGGRRRRQLQKNGGSLVRVGRSYETGENHIDHQIESVQGPPDAFEDGSIHLEPIFRVSKNKNFVDTLANILQRIVSPGKTIGPLVGPFHFPGIGEKVYIRLLEPDQPDNLVIRFVSSMPVTEIETTFDKSILPLEEITKHTEIHSVTHEIGHPPIHAISHEPLPLSTDSLRNSYGQHIKPDPLSAGHDSIAKPSTVSQVTSVKHLKHPHISRTYKVSIKDGEPVSIQRVVRHRKRVQYPGPVSQNGLNFQAVDQRNNSQNDQSYQASTYRETVAHKYQYPWLNNTNAESKVHAPYSKPENASSPLQRVKWDPIVPAKSAAWNQFEASNSSGSVENGPRYSIQFSSKKMRYLNMDGSVDAPEETTTKKEDFSMPRPNSYWQVIKDADSRSKRAHDQAKKN